MEKLKEEQVFRNKLKKHRRPECKGCTQDIRTCILIISDIKCPCTNCLIKTMCKIACRNRVNAQCRYISLSHEIKNSLVKRRNAILEYVKREIQSGYDLRIGGKEIDKGLYRMFFK